MMYFGMLYRLVEGQNGEPRVEVVRISHAFETEREAAAWARSLINGVSWRGFLPRYQIIAAPGTWTEERPAEDGGEANDRANGWARWGVPPPATHLRLLAYDLYISRLAETNINGVMHGCFASRVPDSPLTA